MTREEIIKGLGEISVCQIWEDEVIDEAIKALEQEPKWVSVRERLPEDDDLYLITFDNGEIDLVAFDRGAFSYSGVIAWMPLPKPYEPQESEEYCDRNICVSNEYNGIGCDECEVTKSHRKGARNEN